MHNGAALVDTAPRTTYNIHVSRRAFKKIAGTVIMENIPAEKKLNPPTGRAAVFNQLKKYAIITLGCIIYSLGISLFIEPANLTSGGMTGISLIINAVTHIPTGFLLIILNIPVFIIGFICFGWAFLLSTGYATTVSSLLMALWSHLFGADGFNLLPFTDNVIVNCVTGGVLFGAGMGLIFRMGASTGGTDIFVKLLRRRFRYIKTGMISLVSDMTIVLCSLFVHPDLNTLFFTALSVVVFTLMFDFVLYGGNTAKMVFIISSGEKAEKICERVLNEIDSGATFIDAQGAYSRENKRILLCVIKPILYPRLRDVVKEEDKNAFMIVSSAKEIYGQGYKNQDDAEL